MRLMLIAVTTVLLGCAHPPVFHGTGARAVPLSVEVSGVEYSGTYVKCFQDGRLVNASGVVLSKEGFSVETTPEGGTMVTVDGRARRWPGRPLLLIQSTESPIRVVCPDIPLRAFERDESLLDVVKEQMRELAEPSAAPLPQAPAGLSDGAR